MKASYIYRFFKCSEHMEKRYCWLGVNIMTSATNITSQIVSYQLMSHHATGKLYSHIHIYIYIYRIMHIYMFYILRQCPDLTHELLPGSSIIFIDLHRMHLVLLILSCFFGVSVQFVSLLAILTNHFLRNPLKETKTKTEIQRALLRRKANSKANTRVHSVTSGRIIMEQAAKRCMGCTFCLRSLITTLTFPLDTFLLPQSPLQMTHKHMAVNYFGLYRE